MDFQFFDPAGEVEISYRRLPHWDQAGALCFVTWRTADSIPENVLRRWKVERAVWLRKRGLDPLDPAWRDRLRGLPPSDRRSYHEHFTQPWMQELDQGHGACVLKRPEMAAQVAESLHSGDGRQYALGDFVVMPNHVHLLVQLPQAGRLKAQCTSWKRWTAGQINRRLESRGRFWQAESFDHLVRSPEQLEYLRSYIADNPKAAGLRRGEFRHYRAK